MQEILLAIVLGIAIGLLNLLSYKIKAGLNKFSTVCLCTMLFCLGAKIGCDDALLAKLGTLGLQAGAVAFGAVCGSVAFAGRGSCLWRCVRQRGTGVFGN